MNAWIAVLLLAPIQDTSKTEGSSVLQEFEKVLKNLHPYADFRLRYELDSNRDDQESRSRFRVRGRLGATYDATDWAVVGARLITHEPDSVDPNSSHVTLGRGYDGVEIQFDRLYAEVKPPFLEGLMLRGGKFEHPFRTNPVFGELVWDGDVMPEGFAAIYERAIDETFKLRLAAGEYITVEQNLLDEGSCTALQACLNYDKHFLAVDYYNWHHPTADGSTVLSAQNAGNEVSGTEFVSEFEILHGTVAASFTAPGLELPLQVAAEAWKNLEAEGDRDFGWALGASLGKGKEALDWLFRIQYQVVEQDSVFSPFAQDDYPFQANYRGLLASLRVMLSSNVNVEVWGIGVQREHRGSTVTTDEDDTTTRFRIDLNIKL